MERKVIGKKQIRLLYIIFSVLFVLVSIVGFLAPRTSNASATEYKPNEDGIYLSTTKVTRFSLLIPLSEVKGDIIDFLNKKNTDFDGVRTEKKIPLLICFETIKYNNKPMLALSEASLSVPAWWSLNGSVTFLDKEAIKVPLTTAGYNLLVSEQKKGNDIGVLGISLQINGRGYPLSSTKDKGTAFELKKLELKVDANLDPSVDDPASENFKPDFITSGTYEVTTKKPTWWELLPLWAQIAIPSACAVLALILIKALFK